MRRGWWLALGIAAFALAAWRSLILVGSLSGLQQSLFGRMSSAPGGLAIFSVVYGVVPALLWLIVVVCVAMLCRRTPGAQLAVAAVALFLIEVVASTWWPSITPGVGASVGRWVATLASLAGPIAFSFGVYRSVVFPRLVTWVAFMWAGVYSGAGLLRVLLRLATGANDVAGHPLALLSSVVASSLLIAFLVAIGLSAVAPHLFGSDGASEASPQAQTP